MRLPFFFSGGITPGTVRANRALVVDSNKRLDTLDIVSLLQSGSAVNQAALVGVTAGVITASKAVVVDANKDAASFRNLRSGQLIPNGRGVHASISTAGAGTYTAANLLTGKIVRATSGASRSDTLDTAANIVAAIPGATVGDEFKVLILNDASAAETITLLAGGGGTFATANKTHVIAQNAMLEIIIRLTNVTAASEAYVIYG